MLKAKNIIYGFCKYTHPPKNKYLISLYRSEELHIIAVFPTSQRRAGVAVRKRPKLLRPLLDAYSNLPSVRVKYASSKKLALQRTSLLGPA